MIEFEPDRFRWEQIADTLRQRISDGTYRLKHLLSEVQLMQEFDVPAVPSAKPCSDYATKSSSTRSPAWAASSANAPNPTPPPTNPEQAAYDAEAASA
ncbi:hypothetical protein [Nonomuraea sp. NPDC048901]|uniref:hypothetical protein n=1 Tax=Nonomuraea sp. NPDC048901 TaxID=3155627 RepID=UPI0033CFF77A